MKNKINVLHISPDFNYVCGVSKYICLLFKEFINDQRIKLFFITNGGDSLIRLEELGIKPVILPFAKGLKNVFYYKQNYRFLKNFCLENKIDIIHSHHRYPEYLSYKVQKEIPVKTITTVHSLVSNLKSISFKSDKIIAVSKSVQKNLIDKFNVPKEKIIQIYNPLDFDEMIRDRDFLIDKSQLGIPEKSKVFLFVGRWTKIKGVDLLLKVFKKIVEHYQNIYLIIISNTPDNVKKKLSVKFKNFIFIEPQKNINSFINLSDVIVLPSKIESFPFIMLEAGLYKKLFIGSNVGGIGEYIDKNINGIIFEKGNADEFFNILEKVINDKYDAEKLVKNLFDKVNTLSSVKSYCNNLFKIYQSLL
jgi:glycosyltransferase involved in cell wall biosynthesis